ncbi:MAG: hypothetical protein ACE5JZ_03895 [Kiloniellales bacterium]
MAEGHPEADGRAARLARARDYPYDVTRESFLLLGGRVAPLDDMESHRVGRVPVLAYGSNQSPAQLRRKFGSEAAIPVQRAWLAGFDVVYSAHFTTYGAVPAMLQVAPGTTVSLAVTWLDAAQLKHMTESETRLANYAHRQLERIDLRLDDGTRLGAVDAYVGRRGSLVHDSAPLALEAVQAEGRSHRATTTAAVLELMRDRVAPGHDLEEFILRLGDDDDFRRRHAARIGEDARPFAWPHVAEPAD